MHSLSSRLTLRFSTGDRCTPQINQILGDFTSLMLLSWHPGESWLHSAQSLQQRLSQNLNHRDVSAIRVMRQLAQQQNVPAVPMPVVFTSALGFEQDNFLAGVICSNRSGASPRRRRSGSITRFMNPKANCALTGILSPRCFLPGRWSASLNSIAHC
ncbi:irp2 [Klebsiella pneumoniae]|uniref:Irp2 n=1 Tax=Klebsiella pneumoniae TaxID=573 RepID=A0A378ARW1_KLEPN|nr:irp2 [Klebsiella pneumoniae]